MPATRTTTGIRHNRGLWKTALILAGLLAIISWESVVAQPVSVHRTFFRGWRYSVDSSEYRKLGPRASELREIMKEHRVCISVLNQYQSRVTAAKVIGMTSALLIGWPLVSQVRGREWIEGYTPLVIVGGTMAIVSVALEAAGSRRLKKAVRFYNRYEGYTGSIRFQPTEYARWRPPAGIVIGLRF